jgi:hypothetical protein
LDSKPADDLSLRETSCGAATREGASVWVVEKPKGAGGNRERACVCDGVTACVMMMMGVVMMMMMMMGVCDGVMGCECACRRVAAAIAGSTEPKQNREERRGKGPPPQYKPNTHKTAAQTPPTQPTHSAKPPATAAAPPPPPAKHEQHKRSTPANLGCAKTHGGEDRKCSEARQQINNTQPPQIQHSSATAPYYVKCASWCTCRRCPGPAAGS